MNNECDLRNFWKKSRQRGEGSVKRPGNLFET